MLEIVVVCAGVAGLLLVLVMVGVARAPRMPVYVPPMDVELGDETEQKLRARMRAAVEWERRTTG